MNWIEAECITNLDDYKCIVTRFAAMPRIGDKVQVSYMGTDRTLVICEIIHRCRNTETNNPIPYIEVELTKSKLL